MCNANAQQQINNQIFSQLANLAKTGTIRYVYIPANFIETVEFTLQGSNLLPPGWVLKYTYSGDAFDDPTQTPHPLGNIILLDQNGDRLYHAGEWTLEDESLWVMTCRLSEVQINELLSHKLQPIVIPSAAILEFCCKFTSTHFEPSDTPTCCKAYFPQLNVTVERLINHDSLCVPDYLQALQSELCLEDLTTILKTSHLVVKVDNHPVLEARSRVDESIFFPDSYLYPVFCCLSQSLFEQMKHIAEESPHQIVRTVESGSYSTC